MSSSDVYEDNYDFYGEDDPETPETSTKALLTLLSTFRTAKIRVNTAVFKSGVSINETLLTATSSSSELLMSTSITSKDVFDVDAYLMGELGPKSNFDTPLRIFLTILYILILFTGICGNILTCFVIIRNRVMHTTTNFYILNLSIADLITLLAGLPVEIVFLWQQYPWPFGLLACVLRTSFFECAAYNSVMTITAFTTERYIAICHPLKSSAFKSKKSVVRIIAIIWIVSIVFSLPFGLSARLFAERQYPGTNIPIPQSVVCNIPSDRQDVMKIAMQISAYLFFLFPMIYVSLLYIFIGVRIRRSLFGQLFNGDGAGKHSSSSTVLGKKSSCPAQPSYRNDRQKSMVVRMTNRYSVDSIRFSRFRSIMRRNTAPNPDRNLASRASITSQASAATAEETSCEQQYSLAKANVNRSASFVPATFENKRRSTAANRRAAAPVMLIAVVVAFFICWCPFHLQRLLSVYLAFESFVAHQDFFNILFNVSGILFYVSPTINPILYSLLSVKFRVAFLESCSCKRESQKSRLERLGSSVATMGLRTTTVSLGDDTGRPSPLAPVSAVTKNTAGPLQFQKDSSKSSSVDASPVSAPALHQKFRIPGEMNKNTLLKSALKSAATVSTPASPAVSCQGSPKKDSCCQTAITFPSSSQINVALTFSVSKNGGYEKTTKTANTSINDVAVEQARSSACFLVGNNYRLPSATLSSHSLQRIQTYNRQQQSSRTSRPRGGNCYPGASLPSTPIRKASVVSNFGNHGDWNEIYSVVINKESAAEIVETISEIYNGDLEDECALKSRIRHLSPATSRKAQVLIAYNNDDIVPLMMPLALFKNQSSNSSSKVLARKQSAETNNISNYQMGYSSNNSNGCPDDNESAPLASPECVVTSEGIREESETPFTKTDSYPVATLRPFHHHSRDIV